MNVVETHALGKSYGSKTALRDCTLAVPDGHVVAPGPSTHTSPPRSTPTRGSSTRPAGSAKSSSPGGSPTAGQKVNTVDRRASVAPPTSRSEVSRAKAVQPRRRARSLRRFGPILGAGAVLAVLAVTLHGVFANGSSYPAPSEAALSGMTLSQRIVAVAKSQVGYHTDPPHSYCNKFSAYWDAGAANCPSGETDEEWCADFAAWAWQEAGVKFTYGYVGGEINGGAVSFYEWGVDNGDWHPAGSGFVAAPGDVAVYGLSLGADPSAVHVAIVTGDAPGQRGPDVVNGDGDRTGFSVVENGTDQVLADAGHDDSTLTGYVSPP